jgi:hypothetical protein
VSYQQQPGFPRVSATTPGNSVTVEHTQNSSEPQAVFKVGPQSEPVQVTLGRQARAPPLLRASVLMLLCSVWARNA